MPAGAHHPACRPTPHQCAEVRELLDRTHDAMALHLDRPWRASRVKHLRAGLIGAWRTQDRQIIARFLGEYRLAIAEALRVAALRVAALESADDWRADVIAPAPCEEPESAALAAESYIPGRLAA